MRVKGQEQAIILADKRVGLNQPPKTVSVNWVQCVNILQERDDDVILKLLGGAACSFRNRQTVTWFGSLLQWRLYAPGWFATTSLRLTLRNVLIHCLCWWMSSELCQAYFSNWSRQCICCVNDIPGQIFNIDNEIDNLHCIWFDVKHIERRSSRKH